MELRDKDGAPLVRWTDPESTFEAWKKCSAGRLCDYSAITYEKLRGPSGIQWPCTSDSPDGTERLYQNGEFWADADVCESYGRDLVTGASVEETEYRALNPNGHAVLRAADFIPLHEDRNEEYPFQLITGRTIYHYHTRTKTGRVPELQNAAPEVWVEVAEEDAAFLDAIDGSILDISSPRGTIRAAMRVAPIRPGTVFVPFHYGYWDEDGGFEPVDGRPGRAANELTVTDWDPVSKQPLFKLSAVRINRVQERP